MYSIQNFAKWLNGRGVNGYKNFQKLFKFQMANMLVSMLQMFHLAQ